MKIITDIKSIVDQFVESTQFYYSKWEAVPNAANVMILKPIGGADEKCPYLLLNFSTDVVKGQQSVFYNLFMEYGAAHENDLRDVPDIYAQAFDAMNTIMARLDQKGYRAESNLRLQNFCGKYGSSIAGMTATLTVSSANKFNLCC